MCVCVWGVGVRSEGELVDVLFYDQTPSQICCFQCFFLTSAFFLPVSRAAALLNLNFLGERHPPPPPPGLKSTLEGGVFTAFIGL